MRTAYLLRLEQKNRTVTEVEVDEVLRLCDVVSLVLVGLAGWVGATYRE